jgi:glycosyltransferase involved in cell wall biosynthesis
MNIALIEPFFTGSHKSWALELKEHLPHQIDIYSMKGRFWKWRMLGAAIELSRQFNANSKQYDLILATSLLDVGHFIALSRRKLLNTPVHMYFHENQLTYPWSKNDRDVELKREKFYGLINVKSALASDKVYFNSAYHMESFLKAAHLLLKEVKDYRCTWAIKEIENKASVLPLGLNLERFNPFKVEKVKGLITWNHRWEYDKNPDALFEFMQMIKDKNLPYRFNIIGEQFKKYPIVFDKIKECFPEMINRFGYQESFQEYANALWEAEFCMSTADHDFFGISVVEAVHCQCTPILPNKLAYPEHFTSDYPLYENLEQALSILENKKDFTFKNYDWKALIPSYVREFE